MTDIKAKMHQIRFRLGLRLTALPQIPKLDLGGRFAAGGGAGLRKRRELEGNGREGEVEGREGKGRARSYC